MIKNTLIVVFTLAFVLAAGSFYIKYGEKLKNDNVSALLPNPVKANSSDEATFSYPSIFQKDPLINILLIGTDTSLERRNNGVYGFNTDATILVSIDTRTKQVLLTSVPRDLWVNGNKINALYILSGWDGLKKAYETITGLEIGGYIMADFDSFRWLVTQIGGVNVEIKNSFTDYSFPNYQDTGIEQVSFTEGAELMSADRALTYARSRKGTNGEGSDLMRAKRQHLILQGIVNSFDNPLNTMAKMDIKEVFEILTKHMSTSLTVDDAIYLWDFYAYRNEYNVRSFVLDDKYLYHPGVYPESTYTAWVFLPRNPTYQDIHDAIKLQLEGKDITEPDISNPSTEQGTETITE